MASKNRRAVTIEDASLRRMVDLAPKLARAELNHVVRLSLFSLKQRMEALAPRSDDEFAPHIADQIDTKKRGLSGSTGVQDPGPTGQEAQIAAYNEYAPNKQPFMRPAAEKEEGELKRNATIALRKMEKQLGGFGGGLT